MAFCVSTCPKCGRRFRLVWRIGGRRLEPSQAIRLACPFCGDRFEQAAVGLVVFEAGREHFPEAVVVEPSCLVAGRK